MMFYFQHFSPLTLNSYIIYILFVSIISLQYTYCNYMQGVHSFFIKDKSLLPNIMAEAQFQLSNIFGMLHYFSLNKHFLLVFHNNSNCLL